MTKYGYRPHKAHLELARMDLECMNQLIPPGYDSVSMPNDFYYGLASNIVINSYLAIDTFVTGQLSEKKETFQDEGKLTPLINRIRKLSNVLGVNHLPQDDSGLWGRFIKLKEFRDELFIHGTPEKFDGLMRGFRGNGPLEEFIETAVEMIGYYYDRRGILRPDWLKTGPLPDLIVIAKK